MKGLEATVSIELFPLPEYTGRSTIHHSAIESIDDRSSDSAVNNGPEPYWLLYSEPNFQGECEIVLFRLPRLTTTSQHLRSLRPIPVPAYQPAVALFQHSGFRGRMRVATGPTPSLGDFNDIVTSIIVVFGMWEFFEHSNYGGKSVRLTPGYYFDSGAVGLGNDILSALRPV